LLLFHFSRFTAYLERYIQLRPIMKLQFPRIFFSFFLAIQLLLLTSCEFLLAVAEETAKQGAYVPSNEEMARGLKEALVKGTGFAVNTLSAEGGYTNDPLVHIPFPPEAQFAADKLRNIGLGNLVDNFEARLNEGAERGAKLAYPIFQQAIRQMSFADVRDILVTQDDDAATQYFQAKTTEQLYAAFAPEIRQVLGEVNATQLWSDVTTAYNKIPFTQQKIETDLVRYTTNRALEGLFLKVAVEEGKIRDNLQERTSDLLERVFGYADRQLQASPNP